MGQVLRDLSDMADYLLLGLVVAAVSSLLLAPRRRRSGSSWLRALCSAGTDVAGIASVVGVLVVTLQPRYWGGGRSVSLVPFSDLRSLLTDGWGTSWIVTQLLGNVLLFLPLGLLLPLRVASFRSARWLLAFAALLSAVVEAVQYLLPLGRSVAADDLLLNVTGAGVGYLCSRLLPGVEAVRQPGSALDDGTAA